MASVADNLALIKRKALAYALANGGNEYDGAAFGDVLGGIAWVESGLGQQPVGDNGTSFALFHTNINGRNLSGIGQRAATPQQLAATLADPSVDIDNSMPELWDHFQRHGGVAKFTKDPAFFTAQVALTGQRPQREAWETVTNAGGYRDGVRIAQGQMAAPQRGSPLQAAAGLASNVSGTVAPSVQVNRTPVQGQITQGFGNPFPMDSGATYQGQQYAHFNKGVDYGAAGGSPVTPTVGGTVILAADDGAGWGPRVVIRDAEGFDHSYGHLDPNSIRHLRPGMTVQNDVQIGVVASGNVGTSTGPHLSYDISKNGEPVDPSPWLAQNVRAPGIPAGQAPSYLSGQGGAGMTTGQGSGDFYQKEISEAQWHLTWAQQRMTAIRNGEFGDPNSSENQNAISELQARIEEESGRLASAQAGLRTHQLTNPAASGANPVEAAQVAGGLRQNTFENSFAIWDALMKGLNMDATIKNQLSGLLLEAAQANIANTDAWVKNQIALGNMTLDQAVAKVQAQAMAATAQAAYNAEELARGQWIDETTFRNFERRLPAGVTEVPGLGKNDALASATRNFGLQPTVLGVTPVDWEELRPERSLQRAAGTMPPVQQFDTAGIDRVAGTIAGIQNPRPEQITPSSINLQGPPNMGALLTNPPGAPDYSDLIAQIMASTAPSQPQQAAPAVQSATSGTDIVRSQGSPNPETGPEGAGSTTRLATTPMPSTEQVTRLLNPGAAVIAGSTVQDRTQVSATTADRLLNPGQALREGTSAPSGGGADREAQIRELLKKFGVGAAGQVGAVASVGRRWLK